MKKFSKILSVALLVALVLSLGVANAFAADPTYSITVTNNNDSMSIIGKTYKAYKVFDLTLGDPVANPTAGQAPYDAYAYSIKNTDWAWTTLTAGSSTNDKGVITTTYGIKLTPSATDSTVYVVDGESMTGENARALADALAKAGLPSSADGQVTATDESVTIPLNVAGYYAVYGTVVSSDPNVTDEVVAALSLTTTEPNGAVEPKASVPELNKKITGEHVLDDAGKAATAEVGKTVSFELDSAVPDVTGYTKYTYKITDTMSDGLTFTDPAGDATNDIAVTIGGVDKTSAVTIAVSGQSFTVTIPLTVLSAATKGDAIVVTYSAVVNEKALETNYEKNTAKLTYSHSPYDNVENDTPESEVYVIDVNIQVDKVANAAGGDKLAGAKFVLFKGATQPKDTDLAWYKYDDTNKKVTWVAKADADEFTTDSEGKLDHQFQGLEAEKTGTKYGLLETVAPTGYNLLDEPIIVTLTGSYTENGTGKTCKITADGAAITNGTVNVGEQQAEDQPLAVATVINNSGTRLPSTGGIGTTIFYVVGGVLVLAAIILLVTKKRMSE